MMAALRNIKTSLICVIDVEDFGEQAEWHFVVTSHGKKTAADGVAGTLRGLLPKPVSSGPLKTISCHQSTFMNSLYKR